MDHYEFEQKIKAYIKKDGRSQAAVARMLGHSRDTFNKWVCFVNRMPDTIIYDFCKLLRLNESQRIELLALAGYAVPPASGAESKDVVIHPHPLQRPPQVEYFTDRREALAQLLNGLQPGKVITLCGPGGIGKTALAAKAVWTLAPGNAPPEKFPDGILFHSFYNQPQVDLALEAFARSFGEEPQPTPVIAAQRALSGRQALLILDGAEDADDLNKILTIRDRCTVLITSRQHKDAVAQWQDMQPLPEEDAVTLLQAWAGKWAKDEEATRQICRMVGALPLAVRLVGRCLAEQGWNASEYLVWLQETPLVALDQGQRQLASVPLLLARSLAQVSELARQVLGVIGLLALAPFDRETITATMKLSALEIRQALGELVNYGLLLRPAETYEVTHALIHTYARLQVTPPMEVITRLAAYYVNFVNDHQTEFNKLNSVLPHVFTLQQRCTEASLWQEVRDLATAIDNHLDLQGLWIERINVIQAALNAAHSAASRQEEGEWLGNLGIAYANMGRAEDAIDYFQQALAIAIEIGDRKGQGQRLGNLGVTYKNLGRMEEAIDYLQQALALTIEIGDRKGQGANLGSLGNAYVNLGRAEQAIDYYQQALTIAKEIGNRRHEGVWLSNLGNAYADLGQVEEAIDHYQQALALAIEIGDRRGEGSDLGNLGIVYADLGQVEKAIDYYQRALVIQREIGDKRNEGNQLDNLGNAYRNLGRVEEAIDHHKQALAIALEISDRRGEGQRLGNLGHAYANLGQAEKVIDHYQQALVIAIEIGDRKHEGEWLYSIGSTYIGMGQVDEAIDHYQRSLTIFEEIKSPSAETVRQSLANLVG